MDDKIREHYANQIRDLQDRLAGMLARLSGPFEKEDLTAYADDWYESPQEDWPWVVLEEATGVRWSDVRFALKGLVRETRDVLSMLCGDDDSYNPLAETFERLYAVRLADGKVTLQRYEWPTAFYPLERYFERLLMEVESSQPTPGAVSVGVDAGAEIERLQKQVATLRRSADQQQADQPIANVRQTPKRSNEPIERRRKIVDDLGPNADCREVARKWDLAGVKPPQSWPFESFIDAIGPESLSTPPDRHKHQPYRDKVRQMISKDRAFNRLHRRSD